MKSKDDKQKIVSLCYNAMFKAVFGNNKYMLSKLVQAIFDYFKININVMDKELTIVNNELSINNVHDKQLVCDYRIKIDDDLELNIEVNKTYYSGVVERNMGYCFKIYGDHFNSGDKYTKFKKYCLYQINFNNFSHDIYDTDNVGSSKEVTNVNPELIREYYLIDVKNHNNFLSKNLRIINVDIAECFNLIYNEDKLREMSDLEKFGALLKANNLEDISHILEKDMIDMEEKDKLVDQIIDMSSDKEILKAVKFEDSIDYRFNLVEEDALERGRKKEKLDMIKNMLANGASIDFISKVSGKTIDEIKEIENSIKE